MLKRYKTITVLLAIFPIQFIGCGEEPGMYQSEKLSFETPIAGKTLASSDEISALELGEEEASDFHLRRLGGPLVPYSPFPLYDYYREPVPFPVPVAPGVAFLEYIHPFYAFAGDSFWYDDDDGLFFRHDDDDN